MNPPLVFKVYSLAKIRATEISLFLQQISSLFGDQRLSGEYAVQGNSRVLSFQSLADFLQGGLPDWRGNLTLVFGAESGASCRCDLLRLEFPRSLSAKENQSTLARIAQFRSNEITMEIPIAEIRSDEIDLAYCLLRASASVGGVFSFGDHLRPDFHWINSSRGIAAGIPGIFPLTCLGKEYVNFIGSKRFDALPFSRTVKFMDNVALEIDGKLGDIPTDQRFYRLESVRRAVGSEFFSNNPSVDVELPAGRLGWFAFVSAVAKGYLSSSSSRRIAGKTPQLDWSGLFE
jgi:hypothetical protein